MQTAFCETYAHLKLIPGPNTKSAISSTQFMCFHCKAES